MNIDTEDIQYNVSWEEELEHKLQDAPLFNIPEKSRFYFWLKPFIKSLLKQQREICADIACVDMPSHRHLHGTKNVNTNAILNAPEPERSKI